MHTLHYILLFYPFLVVLPLPHYPSLLPTLPHSTPLCPPLRARTLHLALPLVPFQLFYVLYEGKPMYSHPPSNPIPYPYLCPILGHPRRLTSVPMPYPTCPLPLIPWPCFVCAASAVPWTLPLPLPLPYSAHPYPFPPRQPRGPLASFKRQLGLSAGLRVWGLGDFWH